MTNWYLLPGKTALGLVLIILRSNTALKITAGNIIQLSFSTFGDVSGAKIYYLFYIILKNIYIYTFKYLNIVLKKIPHSILYIFDIFEFYRYVF